MYLILGPSNLANFFQLTGNRLKGFHFGCFGVKHKTKWKVICCSFIADRIHNELNMASAVFDILFLNLEEKIILSRSLQV